MATIVDSAVGGRAVQLGNEEIIRKMSIGNNWTKLRINLRMVFNGSAPIASARFSIGVCSGSDYGYSSPNCIGWMGVTWPAYVGSTLNYPSTYYQYASGSSASWSVTKKVGSTVTDYPNGDGSVVFQMNAVASGRTSFASCEIFRSATVANNFALRHSRSGTMSNAFSRYDFLRTCDDEIYALTSAWASPAVSTMPVDMPDAPYDCASVVWNKSTPTIEIHDMTVIRFT